MTSATYVINRRADQDRLAQFSAGAAAFGVEYERIAALDGHDPMAPLFLYRDLLGDTFWGADAIKPGAFACYLSHAAAWRRLLASEHEMALICEDDAEFITSPDELIAATEAVGAFDVIFANERAVGWRQAAQVGDGLASAGDVLKSLGAKGIAPGDGIAKAPGGDCYLVSRDGAKALLANLAEDKVIAGVDWMILRRSQGAMGLGGDEWAYLSNTAQEGGLRTFIAAQAIARQAAGESVLSHKTEMTISGLQAQRPIGEGSLSQTPEGDSMDPVFAAFSRGEFFEAPALEMMRRWMPEGGVFVDIGAHVGNHTLFMLRHGGAGRAIPMEFNQRAIRLFTQLVTMNGLDDQIDQQHLGFGLTEERGKKEAVGSKKNLSNNRLREGFVEKINTRPGDVLLRETDVDMIKIDVGGDEREVLKGMRKTMKRQRPILVLDLTRPKSQKALMLVGRLGYVERERAEWRDDEGDHVVAVFTTNQPVAGNGGGGDHANQQN